ncbi:MAG: hypothetical protein A3I05_04190 [Deltaproteobacteria bacterium RIFCSPLOWO2_02_FULL_44_10]|nr:MAG: hypothetical protein A3C46_03665 [Deltaproteobacteria bacterium RIFCSPHIGHO2_02_FULL_44_16]OGQ46344.1 MAG: hypothetical protein A3I05_04190 [Deltaproteobacteria bacterium RIFCSPLOWO2_02_FULL_44_10]
MNFNSRCRKHVLVKIMLFRNELLSFVGLRFDLVKQNVPTPSHFESCLKIIYASRQIFYFVQNKEILAPRNFCDKLSQFYISMIFFIKSPHVPKISG